MTWKRTLAKAVGSLTPDLYRPPVGALFPYAHMVSDCAPLHVKHLFEVPSISKFKSDLDFLCQRFRPLELSELGRIPGLRGNSATVSSFLLSFDDGMREVCDVIAPILRSKGIPAIFFVNSATMDNRQLMWRHKVSLLIERARQQPKRTPPQLNARPGADLATKLAALRYSDRHILDEMAHFFELDFDEYLKSAQPYLTTHQALELARAGFELGAHSASHPNFSELAVAEQKRQIAGCVNFIRALGLPCRSFAFPFHDNGVPISIFNYMKELDLLVSFGTSEARLDPVGFSFQRFALDAENSHSNLGDLLKELSGKTLLRRFTRTELIARN